MGKRRKAFDCVEFKNRVQRELMKEFEARRGEFRDYAEFINVTAGKDPRVQALRKRLGLAAEPPKR